MRLGTRSFDTPTARRTAVTAVAALALVAAVAACGGKSPEQLANDALAAGVAAHQAGNIAETTIRPR